MLTIATAMADADFADSPSSQELAFVETIFCPVLVNHCHKCHSAKAEKIMGDGEVSD